MSVNYQKLYSYLVGQIDETLQEIAGYAMNSSAGRDELFVVGNKLKKASVLEGILDHRKICRQKERSGMVSLCCVDEYE